MKTQELYEIIKTGKKPVIQFNEKIVNLTDEESNSSKNYTEWLEEQVIQLRNQLKNT